MTTTSRTHARGRLYLVESHPPAPSPPPLPRWVGWSLAGIFLLMLANIGFRNLPGDMILYFDYANFVKDGYIPYRDFTLEYPPLALVPILTPFFLAHWATGFFNAFETLFAVEAFLLALGGAWLVWQLMDDVLPGANARERSQRLAVYVLAWPVLGQLVSRRIDLLPAVLVVLALWLWLREREGWAWLALAVGVAVKLFPVVVAPLFALELLRRRGWRAAFLGGAWFSLCTALLFLPALLASPSGLAHVFTYHSQRGTQIESLWANGQLLLARVTSFNVKTAHAFGAFEAVSNWTPALRAIATLTQVVGLGAVYVVFALRPRSRQGGLRSRPAPLAEERPGAETAHAGSAPLPLAAEGAPLLLAATLAITVFIIAGKVFSPQYFVWLIPLIVLTPGATGWRLIKVFLVTLALTQVLFPYAYHRLLIQSDLGLLLLTLRNGAFLVFACGLASWFVRGAQEPVGGLVSVPVTRAEVRA